MAIDFPSAGLTVGQIFTSGGASWKWDGTKWVSNAASDGYLPLAGGTITPGSLTVNMNAAAPVTGLLTSTPLLLEGADGAGASANVLGIAGNPTFNGHRANGTGASRTAVANGNFLVRLTSIGWDGTAWGQAASVNFTANENWTASAHGTVFSINTTPNGTTTGTTSALLVDGAGNLTILGSTATKPGGGSWVAPSDPQLKDAGATVPYLDGLDAIEQLRPIRYQYSGKGGLPKDGTVYVGLDAREAAQVLPSLVGSMTYQPTTPNEDGEAVPAGAPETYLTVDPSELMFTLINSVRELSARLTAMEAKLA